MAKLSRRTFLGCLLAVSSTSLIISRVSSLLTPKVEPVKFAKKPLTDADKELLIAKALETEEGRAALAASMVEPIRRSLEYQAVGRKILFIDELPKPKQY